MKEIDAVASRTEKERKREHERRIRKHWEDFWVRILHSSPGGPTFFYPPGTSSIKPSDPEVVPQYLFQTFDQYSFGTNNENLMASIALTEQV